MTFALVSAWAQQCREPASTENCPACAWTEDAQGTVHKNTEARADFGWAPAGPFFLALLVFKQPGFSLCPKGSTCGQKHLDTYAVDKQGSFSQGLSRLPLRAVQRPSSLSAATTFSPQAPASSTQSQQRGPWGGEVALKPLSRWRRTRSMHRCKCTACCLAQLDTCT